VTDLLTTALQVLAFTLFGVLALALAFHPFYCSSCRRVAVVPDHDCSRSTHRELHAAAQSLTFTPAPELTAAQVNPSARTISGLVIPWGEYGDTSVGRVIARSAAAVRVPEDLTRIKLVATSPSDHFAGQRSVVGYATAAQATDQGLHMTFSVGRTPEGDRALLEASEHLADAFSVELTDLQLNGDEIADSLLSAVAQLGVPAFASARVTSVTAAQHTPTQEGTTMTEEQRKRLQELLGMNQRTPEQEQEFQNLSQLAVQEAATAAPAQDAPAADQAPQQAAAGGATTQLAQVPQGAGQLLQQPQVSHLQVQQGLLAAAPAGLQAGLPRQQRPLSDLYAATARVLSGQSRPELEAALADITQGANAWVSPDQYAGQLWSGIDYTRRWVQLMASGQLTSYKGTGWRWVTPPEVDDYAGDKAPVPSNAVETEDAPWVAARLAGAHDLDRKFVDFSDTEFIQAYYHAMTMSYARKSDRKARLFLVAQATAGAAIVGDLLRAAAEVAQRVEDATDGATADWVMVNNADKLALLDMTDADVPAFLDVLGITPDKFLGTPDVPAGTVVAGNRNASEFKELPGAPIRVETVNIVNGGVDGGVFGYYATLLHDATGIQKATFAPAP
jgi:hypothetical protein